MSQFEKDDLLRIASLVMHGLSDDDICDAVGISPQLLKVMREDPDFTEAYAEKKLEAVEREIRMNEGWDGIEDLAIAKVIDSFKWNSDPDFALRAAMAANKMTRRSRAPATLDANNGSHVVTITLNQQFVTTLDGTLDVQEKRQKTLPPQRRSDLPNPQQVQNLLTGQVSEGEIVEEINMDSLQRAFNGS